MKQIKKLFTTLLLLCSIVAMAEEVTIDGIKYDVVTKAKVATVIGGGNYSGSIVIPETIVHNEVTYSIIGIGDGAFDSCSGLTSITIPNSVTSIGTSAFWYCSGLTNIIIPNSVTSIGDFAFSRCTSLTNIIIPNSITKISSVMFEGCSGLTNITIPDSVTSIGNRAFEGCSGLTNITIPNNVTSIGICAFYNCPKLTSITIGSGVEYIYSEAFAKCEKLSDIYCLTKTLPSTDSNAFNESYPEYMTLHVPAESINSYKATEPWSCFGNVITLDSEVEMPKCANPVISYNNGKIEIECETADAEFVTTIKNHYTGTYNSNNFEISATYSISVFATAAGYEDSDIINATLCWIDCDCSGNNTSSISIPAKAILVTSSNGVISVNTSLNGEAVEVYTSDGMFIGNATIENNNATIQTSLTKNSIVVIKISEKSIKVVIN
ncbi:MAG: leucine-rich repeat domain-containing protein [Bacteroidaceae bacterium]|nr:leucine-rich repeat domain-containing protein [Bacteroidaceae bacterium]